jgi:hypothetical protein
VTHYRSSLDAQPIESVDEQRNVDAELVPVGIEGRALAEAGTVDAEHATAQGRCDLADVPAARADAECVQEDERRRRRIAEFVDRERHARIVRLRAV